jgi:hypothetical protein
MYLPSEGEHAGSPLHETTVELMNICFVGGIKNQTCEPIYINR